MKIGLVSMLDLLRLKKVTQSGLEEKTGDQELNEVESKKQTIGRAQGTGQKMSSQKSCNSPNISQVVQGN